MLHHMNELTFFFLLVGAIFMASGWILQCFPPKANNPWYGYRTEASRRSPEAWTFAQQYAARMMQRLGVAYVVGAALALSFPAQVQWTIVLGLVVFVIALVVVLIHIERTVRKQFPQ